MLIDSKLPLHVSLNNKTYLLDWKSDHYFLRLLNDATKISRRVDKINKNAGTSTDIVTKAVSNSTEIKFQYQIPDYMPTHIRDFFDESKLPNPTYSTYVQCHITSAFIPDNSLTILIGYAEKYRKYFYPLIFNLDNQVFYLTSQPIYYNYNQIPSIETEFQLPILKLKYNFGYFSSENTDETSNPIDSSIENTSSVALPAYIETTPTEDCYNLIRIFTLNPPTDLYQIITSISE